MSVASRWRAGGTEGPRGRDDTSVSYEPMVDMARTLRVRLSVRSALALVFALGLTILFLEIARDAERVIAWALSAMAIAALVYPAVRMARALPLHSAGAGGRVHRARPARHDRLRRLQDRQRRLRRDEQPATGRAAAGRRARAELRVLPRDQAARARDETRRRDPAASRGRRGAAGDRVGGVAGCRRSSPASSSRSSSCSTARA